MILLAVSIIILRLGITFWQEPRLCVVLPFPIYIISLSRHNWYRHKRIFTLYKDFCLCWIENIWICAFFSSLIVVSVTAKQLKAGCCFNAIKIYHNQTGEQSVLLWKQKLLGAFYMISDWVLFKNEFIPVATWHQSKIYSKRVISE